MDKYEIAYVQGLGYAWGRNDQRHQSEGGGRAVDSVLFATAWAELCARDGSRPDIGKGFDNFRDHGRVLAPDTFMSAYLETRGL